MSVLICKAEPVCWCRAITQLQLTLAVKFPSKKQHTWFFWVLRLSTPIFARSVYCYHYAGSE